jgi:hypothetical protein
MTRSRLHLVFVLLFFSTLAPPAIGCFPDPNMCPNNCDDGNPCTTDWCYAGSPICGCVHDLPFPTGEVPNLGFSADHATFSWSAMDRCSYDVVRGRVGELPVGDKTSEVCLSSSLAATSYSDASLPAAGDSYWYLVRAKDSCLSSPGSYGYASASLGERVTHVCP